MVRPMNIEKKALTLLENRLLRPRHRVIKSCIRRQTEILSAHSAVLY